MKKAAIIFIITLIGLAESLHANAQKTTNWGNIDVSTITNADTTVFIKFMKSEKATVITFDYTDFDAKDATLDLGYTFTDSTYVSASSDFPMVLDSISHTKSVITSTGTVTRTRVKATGVKWRDSWAAVKLTKNSVTSGTLRIYYSH